MELNFFVRSDVVQVGTHFEDGSPIIRQSFYVVAENADGYRWAHNHYFCSDHIPDPERDQYLADLLCDRIIEAGIIDLQYWTEIDPCYGSAAYVRENIEEQRWMEDRKEAGIF